MTFYSHKSGRAKSIQVYEKNDKLNKLIRIVCAIFEIEKTTTKNKPQTLS